MTMNFTAPTIKTLERLHWLSDEQRFRLRRAMKVPIVVPCGEHASHALMDRMRTLSNIAETHGVEPLRTHKHEYEYLNTGDTYCPTIIADLAARRFFVCDWGTIAEKELSEPAD